MVDDKYNVLIMKDSSNVKRLRISPRFFKLLGWACLLLVMAAIASGGLCYFLWKEYSTLTIEQANLEKQIQELNIQLERLRNMETIIKESEQNNKNNSGIIKNKNSTVTLPSINIDPVKNSTVSVADLIPAPKESEKNKIPPVAKISNLTVQIRSPKTMRASFDLANTLSPKQLSGTIHISALTQDDKNIDIPIPKEHMNFQISHFKRINTVIPIPSDFNIDTIKSMLVTIKVNNKPILTEETGLLKAKDNEGIGIEDKSNKAQDKEGVEDKNNNNNDNKNKNKKTTKNNKNKSNKDKKNAN